MQPIRAAGRQKASSAVDSIPSVNTDQEYWPLQTQYVAVFSVMPSLLPGGNVSYGVPSGIALAMASRVINEKRTRIDPLHADTRFMKIQKLVDGLKQNALEVVYLLTRT